MEDKYIRNRIYVSPKEQALLKQFRVLVVGLGIGSVIAETALRFGFERITVVDAGVVDESDVNSQNYCLVDVGNSKAETLKKRLLNINPEANVIAINEHVDRDNIERLIKECDVAINNLDFTSNIPFTFDKWCQKYKIPVLHPYNIGWGGLAIVIEPDGLQLINFTDKWEHFEMHLMEHITNYFKFWAQPKPWIEKLLAQYKKEKSALPIPQLSIASWIVAGLCTNLLFNIATGQKVKRYPKFYLSSIIDDIN